MKTNIKVIGVMAILLTALIFGSASAVQVYEFDQTLYGYFATPASSYAISNPTVALAVQSATHDDVCFKVTNTENSVGIDYTYVAVGSSYNVYGFGGSTFAWVSYKNCSFHLSNTFHGYLYY